MSLSDALDLAGQGDTISLAGGLYREPIFTMNAVSPVFGPEGRCRFVFVVERR